MDVAASCARLSAVRARCVKRSILFGIAIPFDLYVGLWV